VASIFLSHSSKNNGWARKLQAWLEAKHHRSLFLDFDREAGLKAGDLWERSFTPSSASAQSTPPHPEENSSSTSSGHWPNCGI
jgi:hypothetical protein